jgi:hypothetical protein
MPEALAKRKRDPAKNRKHQRDHYWRRRNHLGVTPRGIQYDQSVIDMLVRRWFLDPEHSDDPAAVWTAINLLVRDIAEDRSGLRPARRSPLLFRNVMR